MFSTIAELYREAVPWVNWWARDQNLKLLCRAFKEGNDWDKIPNDTNIVESLNNTLRIVSSKNIVVQFSVEYALDCRACEEWRLASSGIDLTFRNQSLPARLNRNQRRKSNRYGNNTTDDYRAPDCTRLGIGRGRENMTALQRFQADIVDLTCSSEP